MEWTATARNRDGSQPVRRALIGVVVEQHRLLMSHERPLAELYWQLGEQLIHIRPLFPHGTWMSFLKENGIESTRAVKAVKIRLSFESPDDVFGLTVEQAYAARRKKRRRPPRHTPDARLVFVHALETICRSGSQVLEEGREFSAECAEKLPLLLHEVEELLQEFPQKLAQSTGRD